MSATAKAEIPHKPLPRLEVDFNRMGELLYGDLLAMGEGARLAKGLLSNWALSAIREATEIMVIKHAALKEALANPDKSTGIFAVNGKDLSAEVDRCVAEVTKAILAASAKADETGKEKV